MSVTTEALHSLLSLVDDPVNLSATPESQANARLIAAAPNLFALVRSYRNTYPLDEFEGAATELINRIRGIDD